MKRFVGATHVKKSDLLDGSPINHLINVFINKHGLNNEHSIKKIRDLFKSYGIDYNNSGTVIPFLRKVAGDYIGLLVFRLDDKEYEFHLVSGSEQEIGQMCKDN